MALDDERCPNCSGNNISRQYGGERGEGNSYRVCDDCGWDDEKPPPPVYEIGKLNLKPDDVLVLKVNNPEALQAPGFVTQVIDHIRSMVGNDRKIMVLGPEFDLAVLTRQQTIAISPAIDNGASNVMSGYTIVTDLDNALKL